jgi:hypothetical protein
MAFFKMRCKDCGIVQELYQKWVVDKETRETVRNFELEDTYCGHPQAFYTTGDCDYIGDDGCGGKLERVFEGGMFSISSKGLAGDHQGFYSPDMGKHFNNKYEAYEYAEANGYKPLSKVNVDDVMQRRVDLDAQDTADLKKIKELEASGVSKAEAYGKTFSTTELKKRGMLDNSIKGD